MQRHPRHGLASGNTSEKQGHDQQAKFTHLKTNITTQTSVNTRVQKNSDLGIFRKMAKCWKSDRKLEKFMHG